MLRSTRSLFRTSSRAIGLGKSSPAALTTFSTFNSSQTRKKPPNGTHQRLGVALEPLSFRSAYATKPPTQPNKIDKEREKELGQQKLEAHPESVSSTSTVQHVFQRKEEAKEAGAILKDVKGDLSAVKDSLSLTSVPTEPYVLGLAGTLPYLATSVSTIFLGWNIRTIESSTSSFLHNIMLTPDSAHQWLAVLEPLQVGYGAVILSFLGAIHWGMEFTEKTPSRDRTRFRYGLGMIAPAVAWPTLLLPVQFALTAQFAAFTFMYFADARAQTRGWTPPWYGTYRFVLTFVVGGAIFLSLVGRAKIGDDRPRFATGRLEETMHDRGAAEQQPYTAKWERLEREEMERVKKEKEEEERKKKEEEKKAKKGKKGGKEKKGKEAEKKDDEDDGGDDEEETSDDAGGDDKGDEKASEGEGSDDKGGDDKKAEKKSKGDDGKDASKDKKDDKDEKPKPKRK